MGALTKYAVVAMEKVKVKVEKRRNSTSVGADEAITTEMKREISLISREESRATVEENGAGFTGVSEISPVRFPSLARRVPKPSPCIKLWDILLDSGCLIPVEAGLQKCSFDVLNQCSLGGWQVLEFLPFEKRGEPQNTNSPTQRNQIKN
ncbi:unnamed protein product [Leuciscus chuanchicus]